MPNTPSFQLAALDWIMAALVLIGIFKGSRNGFIAELMSIATWIFSFVGAKYYAHLILPYLPLQDQNPALQQAAAFITVFALSMFLFSMLTTGLRSLIHSIGAGTADKALGGVLGGGKTILMLIVLTAVLMWTPLKNASWWQTSALRPYLLSALSQIQPSLPAALGQKIITE